MAYAREGPRERIPAGDATATSDEVIKASARGPKVGAPTGADGVALATSPKVTPEWPRNGPGVRHRGAEPGRRRSTERVVSRVPKITVFSTRPI